MVNLRTGAYYTKSTTLGLAHLASALKIARDHNASCIPLERATSSASLDDVVLSFFIDRPSVVCASPESHHNFRV